MSDIEFEVATRRTQPITFKLGGNTLLSPATESNEDLGISAAPAVYGTSPHEYVFTPPKTAVMMLPIITLSDGQDEGGTQVRATFDWFGEGLSDEDNARIQARLRDPKDDLDIEQLSDLIKKITEKSTGRPTT